MDLLCSGVLSAVRIKPAPYIKCGGHGPEGQIWIFSNSSLGPALDDTFNRRFVFPQRDCLAIDERISLHIQ